MNSLLARLALTLPAGVGVTDILPQWLDYPDAEFDLRDALRDNAAIDWPAYLAKNADVRAANMDPCLHFVEYGIYEMRELPLAAHMPASASVPLVSVIIANYNNEAYLAECLESVISQTMGNIEVIVVDDASTDNSFYIISDMIAKDKRLKIIRHRNNQGTFQARKTGIIAAKGIYTMFLDSDDALTPDACETACLAINDKHDIAAFNCQLRNGSRLSCQEKDSLYACVNAGKSGEYAQSELMRSIFIDKSLSWNLCLKLFSTKLCQQAFSELPCARLTSAEDMCALFAICRHAHSLVKIDDPLYIYNYGLGVSGNSLSQAKLASWFSCGDSIKFLKKYAAKYGLDNYVTNIEHEHCAAAMHKWGQLIADADANHYFHILCDQYGIIEVLAQLLAVFANNMEIPACKYQHCEFSFKKKHFKNIGLYCGPDCNGAEDAILMAAQILANSGCSVVLLAEGSNEKLYAQRQFKICPVFPAHRGQKARWRDLEQISENECIDLIFYFPGASPQLLPDLMLFHYLGLPVIAIFYEDYCRFFMRRGGLPHSQLLALKSVQAVLCPSPQSQYFLRANGVNAQCLPQPVIASDAGQADARDGYFAIIGDFRRGSPDVAASLAIVKEIARQRPDIVAFFIYDWDSCEDRDDFYARAAQSGIRANVFLAGTFDISGANGTRILPYQCMFMLVSCANDANLPQLAAVQTHGMPCIVRDPVIAGIEQKDGAVHVPLADTKAVVETALDMLRNEELRIKLSYAAKRYASNFCLAAYNGALTKLLQTWARQCDWNPPEAKLVNEVLRAASFFADKNN